MRPGLSVVCSLGLHLLLVAGVPGAAAPCPRHELPVSPPCTLDAMELGDGPEGGDGHPVEIAVVSGGVGPGAPPARVLPAEPRRTRVAARSALESGAPPVHTQPSRALAPPAPLDPAEPRASALPPASALVSGTQSPHVPDASASPQATGTSAISATGAVGVGSHGPVDGGSAGRLGAEQGSSGPRHGAGGAASGAADADALARYLRAVQRAIAQQAQQHYARGRRSGGDDEPLVLRLRIALGPDGGITGVALVQSSGSPRLDRIAASATERVQLPPPPPGVARTSRVLTLPIRFEVH